MNQVEVSSGSVVVVRFDVVGFGRCQPSLLTSHFSGEDWTRANLLSTLVVSYELSTRCNKLRCFFCYFVGISFHRLLLRPG